MVDLNKMKEEQIKLAEKVILKDDPGDFKFIAACDQAYFENKMIAAIVVFDYKTMEVIEKKYTLTEPKLNYIPGFLSYREMPAIAETYSHLDNKPDLFMVEANGTLHPRKIGMASHLGVLFNIPTIGVTKKLLCGKVVDDAVYLEKEVIGKIVVTKKGANPLYVSPGNLISLKKSIEIVKKFIKEPYKLPYPLAIAHKYSRQIRKELRKD